MSENLAGRARSVVNKDRLEDIRDEADKAGSFCVFVSLYEISAVLSEKVSIPRVSSLWEDFKEKYGADTDTDVSLRDLFEVLDKFQKHTDLNVKKVISNPSFLKHFQMNSQLEGRVVVATGYQEVDIPHMRILAK